MINALKSLFRIGFLMKMVRAASRPQAGVVETPTGIVFVPPSRAERRAKERADDKKFRKAKAARGYQTRYTHVLTPSATDRGLRTIAARSAA